MGIIFKKKDKDVPKDEAPKDTAARIKGKVDMAKLKVKQNLKRKKEVVPSADVKTILPGAEAPEGFVSMVGKQCLYNDEEAVCHTHRYNGIIEIEFTGKGMSKVKGKMTCIDSVVWLDE
jgi:hypothetical protein